jgi:hypothetical protein
MLASHISNATWIPRQHHHSTLDTYRTTSRLFLSRWTIGWKPCTIGGASLWLALAHILERLQGLFNLFVRGEFDPIGPILFSQKPTRRIALFHGGNHLESHGTLHLRRLCLVQLGPILDTHLAKKLISSVPIGKLQKTQRVRETWPIRRLATTFSDQLTEPDPLKTSCARTPIMAVASSATASCRCNTKSVRVTFSSKVSSTQSRLPFFWPKNRPGRCSMAEMMDKAKFRLACFVRVRYDNGLRSMQSCRKY